MVAPVSNTRNPAHVVVVEPGVGSGDLADYLGDKLDVNVLAARSAMDAVEVAGTCAELRVAVIRWNAQEPGCLELVESLRQLHPDLGVVLLSSEADPDSVRDAIAAEVDEFVVEPTSPDYIREVVGEMLTAHDLHWSALS